jgi:uncharacterized protein (UPF0332 family)
MPFDWNQYLSLANELAERSDEAALRSAISRAYYGALCLARNFLITKGELDKNAISREKDSHTIIWQAFKNGGKTRAGVYQNGLRLKFKRKEADYEDDVKGQNDNKIVTDLPTYTAMALRDANNIDTYLKQII